MAVCRARLLPLCWLLSGAAHSDCPIVVPDSATPPALVTLYAGNYDTDALLREPFVHDALGGLPVGEKQHFLDNLYVRGSVDIVSGALSLAGNAAHRGGEEEAVLCIEPVNCVVSMGLLSAGIVTIYASNSNYEAQSLCIKDWITQVNSAHDDRFRQPANVRLTAY